MFGGIEKFLFEKFPQLPLWARICTYFVLLGLFVYLILAPRFIDGQIVFKDKTSGGLLPYRGAEIQMQVAGRPYKFVANEQGYFSVPIVSLVPETVELQVLNADLQLWFKVKFGAVDTWKSHAQQIEVIDSEPYIRVVSGEPLSSGSISAMAAVMDTLLPVANAAKLLLKSAPTEAPPPPAEENAIKSAVLEAVGKATGRPAAEVSTNTPLSGASAPSYVQKIQIIQSLESKFKFVIPDEHWKSLNNVGELVDYVQKRQLLQSQVLEKRNAKANWGQASWPMIQQSLPPGERPVFKP